MNLEAFFLALFVGGGAASVGREVVSLLRGK